MLARSQPFCISDASKTSGDVVQNGSMTFSDGERMVAKEKKRKEKVKVR